MSMSTNNKTRPGRAVGLALFGVLIIAVTMIGGVIVGRATHTSSAAQPAPVRSSLQQLRIELADCTPAGGAYSATGHRGLALTKTDSPRGHTGYTLTVDRAAMVWPAPAIGHADGWVSVGTALDLNAQLYCHTPDGSAVTSGLTVTALPWSPGVTIDIDCANGDAPPTAPTYTSTGHVTYHDTDGTESGHVAVTSFSGDAVLHATCPAR